MIDALSPEVQALLTLHLVPGIGPRLTAALLGRFGSAEGVLRARPDELCQVPHVGELLAGRIQDALRRADVSAELACMAKHDVHLHVLGTADYPAVLAKVPDPPHLLYRTGTLEPRDAKAVALVGSRQCTAYGRKVAERLAGDLARAGYTVVSGLARGIDGMAHRGALKAGGRTLAILAGGLSRIYPPEHKELADEVMARIAAIMPVTAVSLAAAALLRLPGDRVTRPGWEALMDELRSELRRRGARVIGEERPSAEILDRALVMLTLRRVVTPEGDGFRVDRGQDRLLRYYANSIDHFFGDSVGR